tara:strand:+ start:39 stop:359 length:321 start_codon:yes stop_codon:yes gene_type:complete
MKIEHDIQNRAMVNLSESDRLLIKRAFKNIGNLSNQAKALNINRQVLYTYLDAKKIELKRLLYLQAYLKINIINKKDLFKYIELIYLESEHYGIKSKLKLMQLKDC